MAKKRKAKKSVAKFVPFVLLGLAVLVICMGFLAGVTLALENMDPQSYTLFEVAFGKELAGGAIGGLASGKTAINFSFLAALGLFLPVIGAVVSLLLKNKIGGLIAFLLFVGSAVLLFLVPQVTSISVTAEILGNTKTTTSTFAELEWTLGLGSIIAGVGSSLGALVSLVQVAK